MGLLTSADPGIAFQ